MLANRKKLKNWNVVCKYIGFATRMRELLRTISRKIDFIFRAKVLLIARNQHEGSHVTFDLRQSPIFTEPCTAVSEAILSFAKDMRT